MAAPAPASRKHLSIEGLLRTARSCFEGVPDTRRTASVHFSLPDTLMAALAMFQFKCASLLRFDEAARDTDDTVLIDNLERLYHLDAVPSDTQMREILDAVPPPALRTAFRAVIGECQRGGVLEDFTFLDERLLVSIDGTGLFSSSTVHCSQCGVRKVRRGSDKVEYYHQMLVAAIVSPDRKTVLPLDFEPIVQSDGDTKDLSEHNSTRRLVVSLAAQYPKLKSRFLVLEDALSANGPHVRQLTEHGIDFLIGVRQSGSPFLFDAFDALRIPANVTAVSDQRDRTAPRRGTGASFLLRAVTIGQAGTVGVLGVGAGLSHRSSLQLQTV